jgi:hypothetical protein
MLHCALFAGKWLYVMDINCVPHFYLFFLDVVLGTAAA